MTIAREGAEKDAKQLEFSSFAGEKTKWQSHFGKQFGSYYKVKHTFII